MLPVGGGGKRSCRNTGRRRCSPRVFGQRLHAARKPIPLLGPTACVVRSAGGIRGRDVARIFSERTPEGLRRSQRGRASAGRAEKQTGDNPARSRPFVRSFVQTARPIARSGESHHQSQPPRNIVVFWRSLRVCCTQETPLLTERLNKSERRSHARSPILAATRST